jgi:hypothetical protein
MNEVAEVACLYVILKLAPIFTKSKQKADGARIQK